MGATAAAADDVVERKNRSGLTEKHLKLLRDDFARLEPIDPELPEAALGFVVKGEPSDVLTRLSRTPGCGTAMGLFGCVDWQNPGGDRTARYRLFENPPATDARFFLRLAQVYHAAARPDLRSNQPVLGLPYWVAVLLVEATSSTQHGYAWCHHEKVPIRADLIEQVIEAGGESPELLARAVVLADTNPPASHQAGALAGLDGFGRMLERHPGVIAEGLNQPDAARRIYVLELLRKRGVDPGPFMSRIVELAVSPAKTVRRAAEELLGRSPDAAIPVIRAKAASGSNDERVQAVQLLWRMAGEAAREFLAARSQSETAARVKAAIDELLVEAAPRPEQGVAEVNLPPVAPVERLVPLTPEARAAFAAMVRSGWEALRAHAQKYPQFGEVPPPPDDAGIATAIGYLEGTASLDAARKTASLNPHFMNAGLMEFAARSDLALVHVVRLAAFIVTNDFHYRGLLSQILPARYFAQRPRFSLRDLAATLEAAGEDEVNVAGLMFTWPWAGLAFLRFDAGDVWPYFAEHPELLEQTWREESRSAYREDAKRKLIFRLLAMFPSLPPRFARLCWDIAFNGSRKDRPLAQAALAKQPDKEERILAALASGKADHRAIAAEWLAKLGYRGAIPALKKALDKENQDNAAGAMMIALESLGVPLDEFVSMDGLLKEAKALLEKGIPKELSWLNLDHLPAVRWAATGKPVRKEILGWMIVKGDKLGSPEPGPRLRQYASYFDRGDAEDLGQYVLEAWIAQDTIPHTGQQAHQHAEQFAAQMAGFAQHSPQYFKGTKEEWYRQAYAQKLAEPVGSAIKQKGVLAVAGACCGGRAGPPVEQYLKTYYGYRVHQCKALIRMLSWIEHPSAIQVLLSISGRFRTASIRKEAEACVSELAERKNWTIDELADRTIPTAGMEDAAGLVLDYGPRQFTARLDGEFKLVLRDEQGKTIKSLPAPRQSDDADKAKAAKKALAAARKEIESVLKMQKERLYEAMCTQRTWAFADWDRFLNRHPIVRHYCQRLVWCVREDGKVAGSFRPLDDGTLTDTDDEAVAVAEGARIGLAHECLLSPGALSPWQQHLADYEVRPLFEQFGKGSYRLPDAKQAETSLDDFQGHLLEAFRLRGRLSKLGYTRGPTGDGGWFYEYLKHFPSLGLTAAIEFTGNGLPEENRTVALTTLRFHRGGGDNEAPYGGSRMSLPLGEVPPVLLSECWNDMRLAAAEGSGFDPEWAKKTEF